MFPSTGTWSQDCNTQLLQGYNSILSNGIIECFVTLYHQLVGFCKWLLKALCKQPKVNHDLSGPLSWAVDCHWIEKSSCCSFTLSPGCCMSPCLAHGFLSETRQASPLFTKPWRQFRCTRTDTLVSKGESLSPPVSGLCWQILMTVVTELNLKPWWTKTRPDHVSQDNLDLVFSFVPSDI